MTSRAPVRRPFRAHAGARTAALAALLAAGCGPTPTVTPAVTPATPGAPNPADAASPATRDLLDADRRQARAIADMGFADGFVDHLSDQAVYLPPGTGPVRGVAAIRDHLAASHPAVTGFDRTVARADVSRSGDLGYTFGWTVTTVGGAPVHGKYLAAWVRDDAGAWRLAAYLPNASPGPAAEVPAWFREVARTAGNRFAGPTNASAPLASALAADRAFASLAGKAGTSAAFGHYAAADGVAVGDGAGMVFGRDAIRDAYAFPPGYELRWTPLDGIAARAGDLAVTWGSWELDVATDEGVATRYGKYLSLWQREPSGEWRFVADGGNSSPPANP